ncbi:hypothetical protein FA95DRAFT_1345263 [Auriscalpium vulgare]|uniref:Uncharacterized protein n=1 Tax=Auriscalpium vulgare TaxID=40419 RepID=A0ACB8RRX7_9AGAM|nr:hypothetical protein FA95DRAFT_1345263 [Auriscalpium vulgare]
MRVSALRRVTQSSLSGTPQHQRRRTRPRSLRHVGQHSPITSVMSPSSLPGDTSLAPSSSTSAALHDEQPADDAQTVTAGPSPPPVALPTPPPALHSAVSSSASRSSAHAATRMSRVHPYARVCPHCSFVQENGRLWDLKRHVKTHDPVRRKFVCGRGGCGEAFSRKDAVMRHQSNPNARCAIALGDNA